MRLRALAAAICCLVAFSGCAPLQTNVESLMQPPKLTELQYQVDTALRDAVGKAFMLKYPRNGSYKSAFNFIDLDGDGNDEALAFFSDGDELIQIAVLSQAGGAWQVTDIVPGIKFCSEVDFVFFEPIGERARLMVGWGGSGQENNIMAVYEYRAEDDDQQGLALDSRWDYNRMTITDLDRNGSSEVLLLVSSNSDTLVSPTAQLVGETSEGLLDLLAEIELPRNIAAFFTPLLGELGGGFYGATIDCMLNNGKFCTVTLTYTGGKLNLPLNPPGDAPQPYRATTRTQLVLSADVNEDGQADIPIERPAVGYEKANEDAVYFIDYSNPAEAAFTPIQTAYINPVKGYRFLFPKSWREQPISAFVQSDGGEVILFLNTTGDRYDHSQELVRFKVYSTLDGQDKLDENRYFQLATKGTYAYCAALPAKGVEALSLTKKQVTQLFSLTTS